MTEKGSSTVDDFMIIQESMLKDGELPLNSIIHGDVCSVLKKLPSDSVDCVITSPPYYALRKYPDEADSVWGGDPDCEHEWELEEVSQSGGQGEKSKKQLTNKGSYFTAKQGFCKKCGAWRGQLGLEPTPSLYVEHLGLILKEIYRVLKPTGTFFLNIGDSYSGSMGKRKGWSSIANLGNKKDGTAINVSCDFDLPRKCLLCMPERVLFKCLEIGFICRNKIIWHKPNHLPESVRDRFTTTWEYVFLLTKKPKGYYFNLDAVREPYSEETLKRIERFLRHQEHFDPERHKHGDFGGQNPFEVLENVVKSAVSFNIRVRDAQKGKLEAKWGDMYKASEEEIKSYCESKSPMSYEDIKNDKESELTIGGIGRFWVWQRSKFLSDDGRENKGASPGARALLSLQDGKLKTFVRKSKCDVNSYLKEKLKAAGLSVKELAEKIGVKESTLAHYFRTDESGKALPDKGTWEAMKPILDLGDYEEFIEEEIKPAVSPVVCSKAYGIEWYGGQVRDNHDIHKTYCPKGKNPGDMWSLTTEPFKEAHFAIFPTKLVVKCILSGCPPDGIVLDPFLGSGTVAYVCELLNKKQFDKIKCELNDTARSMKFNLKFIGIEKVFDYCKMAERRIKSITHNHADLRRFYRG